MEVKKSEKANLKNNKLLFIEIGMVLALGITYFAFEWQSKETDDDSGLKEVVLEAEEEMIITQEEQIQEQAAPPEVPELSDEIDIVDDEADIVETVLNTDDTDFVIEQRDYVEEVVEEVVEEEEVPFQLVEVKPSFQGGDANDFSKWVAQHLEYPESAKENGVQGRVMLQFTIGTDGKVGNIKVLRGVDPLLDKEAVRVVSMSPKWTPGKQRDRAAKVTYTFPVIFQLR